jgi:hypothetical protein
MQKIDPDCCLLVQDIGMFRRKHLEKPRVGVLSSGWIFYFESRRPLLTPLKLKKSPSEIYPRLPILLLDPGMRSAFPGREVTLKRTCWPLSCCIYFSRKYCLRNWCQRRWHQDCESRVCSEV